MLATEFEELKRIANSLAYEAKDIKALFSYDRIDMLEPNKNRLKVDIDCAISDLEELKQKLKQHGLYKE